MKEQGLTPHIPRVRERGIFSEEALVGIITAVGIDERRALTIAAMEPNVVYTKTPLHARVMQLQGPRIRVPINRNTLYALCDQISRTGLVRRFPPTPERQSTGFAKMDDGEEIGDSAAGLFLSLSESMPPNISLIELWGKAGAQKVRLKIFQQLLKPDPPTTQTELAHAIGESQPTVSIHLNQLSPKIITYDSPKAGQTLSFQLSPQRPDKDPEPFKWRGPRTAEIYAIVLRTSSQWVSPETVTDMLIQAKPELANINRDILIARTRQILTHLEKQGFLNRKQDRRITLSPEQRNFLSLQAIILDGIQNQNPRVLEIGRQKAAEILSNRQRVIKLLRKVRGRPQEPSKNSVRETENRLLAILAAHPNISTNDVRRIYGLQYGKQLQMRSMWERLDGLRKKGSIQTQREKNVHKWNLSRLPGQREKTHYGQGRRFFERRARIMDLWQEGRCYEAFEATRIRNAEQIFYLLEQTDPYLSYERIAEIVGGHASSIGEVAGKLTELGIPLTRQRNQPKREKPKPQIA